jgi:hypothetical protein
MTIVKKKTPEARSYSHCSSATHENTSTAGRVGESKTSRSKAQKKHIVLSKRVESGRLSSMPQSCSRINVWPV